MMFSLTLLFMIMIFLGSYIIYIYSKSRNKRLLFQEGLFKSAIWNLGILFIFSFIIWLFLPEKPIDLSNLVFHSERFSLNDQSIRFNLFKYYSFMFISVFTETNLLGLFSALMVMAIWYFYIRNLVFFNQEKLSITISVLILGIIITSLTFPLSDFVHELFNIKYSENTFYNLFIYCFVGIGMVEELIKLVPVLLVLYFTNEIDEPFDLIYYACLSALGFAFVENLIYFRDISGSIVIGRALTSAIAHMVDSTIVVYGIILIKFNPKNRLRISIFLYFLLGAFIHALYDYFLFESLIILFIPFFIFSVQIWAIMINNAMNNSPYFTYSSLKRFDAVRFNLSICLTGMMLLNFLLNGLLTGRSEASQTFIFTLPFFGLLIIFYVSKMSSIDLFKGYWRPIKFKVTAPNENAMPGVRGFSSLAPIFMENSISPLNHVGKRIKLHSPGFNTYLSEVFTVGAGKIIDRVKLVKKNKDVDVDWFLVKLDEPLDITNELENRFFLIKFRNKYESLIHDEHIECAIKFIPKGKHHKKDQDYDTYPGYGSIMINGDDYQYNDN